MPQHHDESILLQVKHNGWKPLQMSQYKSPPPLQLSPTDICHSESRSHREALALGTILNHPRVTAIPQKGNSTVSTQSTGRERKNSHSVLMLPEPSAHRGRPLGLGPGHTAEHSTQVSYMILGLQRAFPCPPAHSFGLIDSYNDINAT